MGATGLPRLAKTAGVAGIGEILPSERTAGELGLTWTGCRSPGHGGDDSRHHRVQDGSAPNPAEHMDLLRAATAWKLTVPKKPLRPVAVRLLWKILKHPGTSCQSCPIPYSALRTEQPRETGCTRLGLGRSSRPSQCPPSRQPHPIHVRRAAYSRSLSDLGLIYCGSALSVIFSDPFR